MTKHDGVPPSLSIKHSNRFCRLNGQLCFWPKKSKSYGSLHKILKHASCPLMNTYGFSRNCRSVWITETCAFSQKSSSNRSFRQLLEHAPRHNMMDFQCSKCLRPKSLNSNAPLSANLSNRVRKLMMGLQQLDVSNGFAFFTEILKIQYLSKLELQQP